MAGGRNLRYGGAHKALMEVGGVPILERVRAALAAVCDEIVIVANEREVYAPAGLPIRPDVRPGLGAVGGILTAALWAREAGRPGAVVVACDMPFVPAPLLAEIVRRAGGEGAADIVAPESGSRRGLEPLCAFYGTGCAEAIESAIERKDLRVIGFWDELSVERIPLEHVQRFGEPGTIFMNVNTPEERESAERIATGGAA